MRIAPTEGGALTVGLRGFDRRLPPFPVPRRLAPCHIVSAPQPRAVLPCEACAELLAWNGHATAPAFCSSRKESDFGLPLGVARSYSSVVCTAEMRKTCTARMFGEIVPEFLQVEASQSRRIAMCFGL